MIKSANSRGFTLVEVLVVIVIIIILAAILLSVFNATKKSAKTTVAVHRVSQFSRAAELYSGDHDSRYPVENPYGAIRFFAGGASDYKLDPLKPYGMLKTMYFCDQEPERHNGRLPLARLVSRFYFDYSEANGNWSWPFALTPQSGTVIAYDTCQGKFPDSVSPEIQWLYTSIDGSVKKIPSSTLTRIYYQPDNTWRPSPQTPFSYLQFPGEPDPSLTEIK